MESRKGMCDVAWYLALQRSRGLLDSVDVYQNQMLPRARYLRLPAPIL
jgi:hypothetical protein